MDTKAYLIEGQILHQLKKMRDREAELTKMYKAKPREITEESYKIQMAMCYGATTQLMIVLSCHDNELSNFQAEEEKEKKSK